MGAGLDENGLCDVEVDKVVEPGIEQQAECF